MIKFVVEYINRCKIPTLKEIEDAWVPYIAAHQNRWNRLAHLFGQVWTIFWFSLFLWLSLTKNIIFAPLLLLTPFVIYLVVWPAHLYLEKTPPATFKQNPVITKLLDL